MEFRASRIAGLTRWTKPIFPDKLTVTEERVYVVKRKWMGLAKDTGEVSMHRVASVRLEQGVIWARVTVETFGGAASDLYVDWMRRGRASDCVDTLRRMIDRNDDGRGGRGRRRGCGRR